MDSFQNLTRMDRRKFLAGFLATAASAGVLGKLGVEESNLIIRHTQVTWGGWALYHARNGNMYQMSSTEMAKNGINRVDNYAAVTDLIRKGFPPLVPVGDGVHYFRRPVRFT